MAIHALDLDQLQHGRSTRRARPRPVVALASGRRERRWAAYSLVVIAGVMLFMALDLLRARVADVFVSEARPVASRDRPTVELPVVPGDSLWSVVVALRPGEDPRPLVDELARLNGGPGLQAGGSVVVPAEWVGLR
jgi:hypothetical protein